MGNKVYSAMHIYSSSLFIVSVVFIYLLVQISVAITQCIQVNTRKKTISFSNKTKRYKVSSLTLLQSFFLIYIGNPLIEMPAKVDDDLLTSLELYINI